ncbi:hypothetical protein CBL_00989 [Carabus blaptoides fortunei]
MDPNWILKPNYGKSLVNTLSILIVAKTEFCKLLSEAFIEAHKRRNFKYKLKSIICADVHDIFRLASEVHVDFVVFVLDTRNKLCLEHVESNLEFIDKCFVCGRMCLVNANPQIALSEMNVSVESIRAFRCKYDMPLLNANIKDVDVCLGLADRLLNLVHANLGVELSTSFIPWLISDHNIDVEDS